MIRDRLPDLLRLAQEDPSSYYEPEHHANVPMPPELEVLLKNVEKILKFSRELVKMIEDLKLQHQGVLTSASVLNANQLRNEITATMNRFTALARKSKAILKRIELNDEQKLHYALHTNGAITKLRKTDITVKWDQSSSSVQRLPNWLKWMKTNKHMTWPPAQTSSEMYVPAEIRMQILLHDVLSYRLTNLVQEFYTEQKNYNEMSKRKIERQLSIMGEQMDSSRIEEAMSENIPLLHPEIIDDQQISKEMKIKLKEVAHFESEILQLEKSITHLHQAFKMMATLVDEQGVIVDRIEHHVILACDYVESSNQQLKKAVKLQHKYRKKRCILAIVIIVLVGIVIAIIVVSVVAKQQNVTVTRSKTSIAAVPRFRSLHTY